MDRSSKCRVLQRSSVEGTPSSMLPEKLHTDNSYLSNKSDAADTFKVMSIDHIRDEVMYWLTPMDTVNFIVGIGIFFTTTDMAKYTSPFKYVIPDRTWMIKRIEEGFDFTLISSNLLHMMDAGLTVVASRQGRPPQNNDIIDSKAGMLLVVTKDKMFVPCTDEFMPT